MTTDINALAGPEFLVEVKAAHAAYGIAIGVTQPAKEALEVNLAGPLRALSRSIGRYGLAVAGTVDDEDDATLTAARKALRPIGDFREELYAPVCAGKAESHGATILADVGISTV